MLSFPRDLLVPIYCGNGPTGAVDRINSAWSRCGATGTVATVSALTNVRPDYLITVDFHGFKLLVNKLHGVYMDVDHRYLNTQGGPLGYAKIDLEPGYQKLDGEQALDFVRFRHTDSDITRLARQQLFLTALRERLASGSIFNVFKIVGALKGNLEIETGSGKPLSEGTALSYLQFAHGLPSGHFFRVAIDNLSGYNTLTAPLSSVQAAVQQFLHPDVAAPEKANAAALGIKPKPPKPHLKPSQVSVLVLNGTTTIQGGAADTSYRLAQQGYRTVALPSGQLPNAPNQGFWSETQVYFDKTRPRARAAAEVVRKALPGARIAPLPPNIRRYARAAGGAETVVVIGSNFRGVEAPAPPPTIVIPKHEPPQVYTSPGVTLDPIRSVRARLPFVPMVPHVLESHSQLAQLTPLRVYKPAPYHKGLRLTFVLTTTGNEYWGIEETDWNDAPALRHPTVSHVFRGRHFDFYYSGSHLHMVVLRTPKASYWVVNTLLDRLSNETMIAIARGLQPLGK
jgi:LCP family protein required for cell wall assembly